MANQTVPDQSQPEAWTASAQAASSKLKIVKLLELGKNDKGRFARVEFEDESSRPLYLLTIADAWSDIFDTLEPKLCWDIRDHFNARFPSISLADGAKKKFRRTSFSTETYGPRRQYLGECNFDLAAYQSISGTQAGLEIAREVLELYATRDGRWAVNFSSMINEMATAKGDRERDASRAFLGVMLDMVQFFARHANFHSFIDAEVERVKQSDQRLEAFYAERKADFVTRMKAARAAKQQRSTVATTEPTQDRTEHAAATAAPPHMANASEVTVNAARKARAPMASKSLAMEV